MLIVRNERIHPGTSGPTWFYLASGLLLWPSELKCRVEGIPIGSKVVPSCGSYSGSYEVTPKRNYFGAYGYRVQGLGLNRTFRILGFGLKVEGVLKERASRF